MMNIDNGIMWCRERWRSFQTESRDESVVDVCADIYERAQLMLTSGSCNAEQAAELLWIIARSHSVGDLIAFDGSRIETWHLYLLRIAIRDASQTELAEIVGELYDLRDDPQWPLAGHALATRFDNTLQRWSTLRAVMAPFVASRIKQNSRNAQDPDEVDPA